MAKDDIFTPNFQQKSKTLKLLFEKGVTDEKRMKKVCFHYRQCRFYR